jgi:hypothetical protein
MGKFHGFRRVGIVAVTRTNTSNLFSLTGTTLTFNGTTADFESNTKSYTAKVKATTGDRDNQNIEQTITVNLADLNDEIPTDITSIGNLNIAENTTVNTNLVTLSANDPDEYHHWR